MTKNEWETYLLDSAGNKKPIPERDNLELEIENRIAAHNDTKNELSRAYINVQELLTENGLLQAENKTLAKELERAREVLIERLEQEVKRTQKLEGENSFLLDRLQFEVKRTQSLRESIRKAREVLKDDQ